MPRVALLLSFDHELSLGGGESYSTDLFEPTSALLDTANSVGVPICLFTDILSYLRFKEWDPTGFCEPYRRQLHRAVRQGHEVQLHLHPHWMDVIYDRGRFALGDRYSLGDFANGPEGSPLQDIVARGVNELTEICSAANPGYRCIAYRAGGYSYGPEVGRQVELLNRYGILIDSSVAKGYYLRTRSTLVNFREMPADPNWFIEPGGGLAVPGNKGLFEVPIASSPRTPLNNIPFLIKRVLRKKRRRVSAGRSFHHQKDSFFERASRLLPRSAWMLSFDSFTQTADDLLAILRSHVARHSTGDVIYCAAIGHPKSMGAYQLELFRTFLARAKEEFGTALAITTFRQTAETKQLVGEKEALISQ